jgi:predicted dienelactone hydrolase
MRSVEALLVIANLLTFMALTVPLPQVARWMRYSAPIAFSLAVAQMTVEGMRWHMIPAYLLSGLFFLVWLRKDIAPSRQSAELKRTHWAASLFGIGLGILGLSVSVALPMVLPVFRFPKPSGPYEIGTLTYHWVDANRPEIFSADPNAHRELMVQVWYPAKETSSSSPRAPYVQDPNTLAAALARLKHLPVFIFGQLKYVTTHAIPSAPVADDQAYYPVLVFLEGAIGFRQMNTFQVEHLVSHGYIVAAIDQPYTAASVVFPDGHQLPGLSLDKMIPLIHQSYSPPKRHRH